MRIVRTDRELRTPNLDHALVEAGHELILLADKTTEPELIAEVREADLLLMCYTPVTREVIAAAPRLRGIVKYGVGVDAIDIAAAKEHGVVVVNVPEYAEETVAEGAFALMIALAKRLPELTRQINRKAWAWPEPRWIGSDIAGKTVGLVGFGKIGRCMARMCGAGFRARVLAYDPYVCADAMMQAGVEKCEVLIELLEASDFVSVHCVLNDETRHLIGREHLQAMKSTAILINTSRGAIIDEPALVKALRENWIAGLGLDVFSREPLEVDGHPMSELIDHPRVLLSPHLTFYTQEAMARLEGETLERCLELLEGRPVLVKSTDPRLAGQCGKVQYG